jgi:hypothetical protein
MPHGAPEWPGRNDRSQGDGRLETAASAASGRACDDGPRGSVCRPTGENR